MSITRRITKEGISIIVFNTPIVDAAISVYGAHLLYWKPKEEKESIIYLSKLAKFERGTPIRGGIPICWPWFGTAGTPRHGYGRRSDWNEDIAEIMNDGSVHAKFTLSLPKPIEVEGTVDFHINATQLTQSITTTNNRENESFDLSTALHAYFSIGDIYKVYITGLQNAKFVDNVKNEKGPHQENPLRFNGGQIDRTYNGVSGVLELHDEDKNRIIRIVREGSNSAIVWNAGEKYAKSLPDMEDEDYHRYVCLETANVLEDTIKLSPKAQHTLKYTAYIVK